MESKIIVMLTHNDQTVENALDVFNSCKDLSVDFWGFKDVGLPTDKMKTLADAMKAAGKKTFLEVVSYTEDACMAGAKLAVEYGFDYLMGTLFFNPIWAYLKDKPIKYFPFVGDVSGSPSVLKGSLADMTAQAKKFAALGIPGVDILSYRHADLDPVELSVEFVKAAGFDVVIAGSISSPERIKIVSDINPYGYTMGSALFSQNFVSGGSFRQNLEEVLNIMSRLP